MLFSKLKEVSLKGKPKTRKDKGFLRQMSTGVYCTLSEKLAAYDPNAVEAMTILRYQAIIVLLCLWERSPSGKDEPYLVKMTSKLREKKGLDPLPYGEGEFSSYFRSLPPKEFVEVADFFCDQCGREELSDVYHVADEHLQPTSPETKEALGNE